MPVERTDPTVDAEGGEHHPSFGVISLHRIHSAPGAVLFQSDVRHPEYIVLEVHEATRKRDLKHDWVHPTKLLMEVSMSMAQFASFIASAGTEGVPATIEFTGTGSQPPGRRPSLKPESRLAMTTAEVRAAADMAYKDIQEAFKRLEEAMALQGAGSAAAKRSAMRDLQHTIGNAAPNVAYAARKLDEHAEDVVEKSRADVEAMVTRMAERFGINREEIQAVEAGATEEHLAQLEAAAALTALRAGTPGVQLDPALEAHTPSEERIGSSVIHGTCNWEHENHLPHFYGNGRFYCDGDVGAPVDGPLQPRGGGSS